MAKPIFKQNGPLDRGADVKVAPTTGRMLDKSVTVTSSGQTVRSVREMLFSDSRKAASRSFESLIKKI